MARLSNPPPPAPPSEDEDDAAMPDAAAAPPTTTEPAVIPGPRAQRLLDLYARSLSHTMGKLSWGNFAACYPTFARRNEPVLKQIQQQMVTKLQAKCEVRTYPPSSSQANQGNEWQAEFETIIKTRNVVPRLNELEQIAADAHARRQADAPPPHP